MLLEEEEEAGVERRSSRESAGVEEVEDEIEDEEEDEKHVHWLSEWLHIPTTREGKARLGEAIAWVLRTLLCVIATAFVAIPRIMDMVHDQAILSWVKAP